MAPHFKDEAKLIAISKAGRKQLEEQWALERRDAAEHSRGATWHKPAGTDGAVDAS